MTPKVGKGDAGDFYLNGAKWTPDENKTVQGYLAKYKKDIPLCIFEKQERRDINNELVAIRYYIKDDKGNIVEEIYDSGADGTIDKIWTVLEYDKSNQSIKKQREIDTDGDNKINKTETVYKQDGGMMRWKWYEDKWYDKEGKIERTCYQEYMGGRPSTFITSDKDETVLQYFDPKGELREKIIEKSDGTETVIAYEYWTDEIGDNMITVEIDNCGKIESDTFKSSDGDKIRKYF